MIILLYYNLLIIHKQVFKILDTIDMDDDMEVEDVEEKECERAVSDKEDAKAVSFIDENEKRWFYVKQDLVGQPPPIPAGTKKIKTVICIHDQNVSSSDEASYECTVGTWYAIKNYLTTQREECMFDADTTQYHFTGRIGKGTTQAKWMINLFDATRATPRLRQHSGYLISGVLIVVTHLNGNQETFTEFFEAMNKWFHALDHLKCVDYTTTYVSSVNDDVEMADI